MGGLRPVRLAAAAVLLVLAFVLALAAHDVLAWRSTVHDGDRALAAHPRSATWNASAWLPGDPLGSMLGLAPDLSLRRAVRSFDVAVTTPRGFDQGAAQSQARAAAEVRLSDVAAGPRAAAASQAGNLLGVLVERAGNVAGGITADDRAQAAFAAAVERDPANAAARYNLELLLRRTKAKETRHGAGNGAGSRGRGHKGAGAGTPGRGY